MSVYLYRFLCVFCARTAYITPGKPDGETPFHLTTRYARYVRFGYCRPWCLSLANTFHFIRRADRRAGKHVHAELWDSLHSVCIFSDWPLIMQSWRPHCGWTFIVLVVRSWENRTRLVEKRSVRLRSYAHYSCHMVCNASTNCLSFSWVQPECYDECMRWRPWSKTFACGRTMICSGYCISMHG